MSSEGELPLDEIAAAACEAVKEGVRSAQVSRLLEVLEDTNNVNIVLAFLAKQVGRGPWKPRAAQRLFNILKDIENIDTARKILGLFKWLFEAGEKAKNRLSWPPGNIKGYFLTYINSCLGGPRR